jgi:AraC family transcriptional regulator
MNSRAVTELAHRLHREFHHDDDLSPLAIQGLTAVLVAETERPVVSEHRPPWIEHAMELLQDRCAESLTLAEIAHEVGIHPVHLARSFSRHTGATVHETIRRLRVERACALLSTTDRSIGEIAHAVGFFDHSHLTRTFRRELGMTPSRYRALRG